MSTAPSPLSTLEWAPRPLAILRTRTRRNLARQNVRVTKNERESISNKTVVEPYVNISFGRFSITLAIELRFDLVYSSGNETKSD